MKLYALKSGDYFVYENEGFFYLSPYDMLMFEKVPSQAVINSMAKSVSKDSLEVVEILVCAI